MEVGPRYKLSQQTRGGCGSKRLPSAGNRSKHTRQMSTDTSIPARLLQLHIQASEDATVIRCTGRLTAETSLQLKTEVKALLPNKRRLILDLGELAYMDSSGLGTLVGLYISAKGAKCEFQLLNLSPRMRELLSMTNLLSLFEACGRSGMRFP
jgi:anti-sigma B factor antagonist